jgi:hypothetical protein
LEIYLATPHIDHVAASRRQPNETMRGIDMTTHSITHGGLERVVNAAGWLSALLRPALGRAAAAFGRELARWQEVQQQRADARALELLVAMSRNDPRVAAELRGAVMRAEQAAADRTAADRTAADRTAADRQPTLR